MVSFGGESRELLAQAVINVLCEEHDLPHLTMVLNGRLGKVLGRALLHKNIIEINPLILRTSALDDTLRHEIAHFYDFYKNGNIGHSDTWKAAAELLGARPIAIQDFDRQEPKASGFRYRYECGQGCTWYARRKRRSFERPFVVCKTHNSRLTRITL